MSQERPKLSTKWWISLCSKLQSMLNCIEKGFWVSWTLVTWLRNHKRFFLNFTQVDWYQRNALDYQQNYQFLQKRSKLWSLLKHMYKSFWISCALVTWLTNNKLLYFGDFTEVDRMSQEYPILLTKWQISKHIFET